MYFSSLSLFFVNSAIVPDHSFDASDGSLQPSTANISPVINFNSDHCSIIWANKSFAALLFVDMKLAIGITEQDYF